MIAESTPIDAQEIVGTVEWFRYQAARVAIVFKISDNEAAAMLINICHEYIKERGYGRSA